MKEHQAEFRFYVALNDFLPKYRRKQTIHYGYSDPAYIKGAIEALGVPHTEVDLMIVNGNSVGCDYHLAHGDRIVDKLNTIIEPSRNP